MTADDGFTDRLDDEAEDDSPHPHKISTESSGMMTSRNIQDLRPKLGYPGPLLSIV